MLRSVGQALKRTFDDVMKNHTMAMAAGLSYYFVMALFPALILAAAITGYLPVKGLFDQMLNALARVMPPDGMKLVRDILHSVMSQHRPGLLSFGIVGSLWTISGGMSGMIEALNVAYDVPETRSIGSTRLLSLWLGLLIGAVFTAAVVVLALGPQFGAWLAGRAGVSWAFAAAWPYLRWGLSTVFTVLGVELLYFLAPNVKQKFVCSLPGATFAVAAWLGLSHLLGIYIRNFAHYNKTYGALGAGIALMVWLYYSSFMILIGAELNSEIMQMSGSGRLPLKRPPPSSVTPKPATEAELAA